MNTLSTQSPDASQTPKALRYTKGDIVLVGPWGMEVVEDNGGNTLQVEDYA